MNDQNHTPERMVVLGCNCSQCETCYGELSPTHAEAYMKAAPDMAAKVETQRLENNRQMDRILDLREQVERLREEITILSGELIAAGLRLENLTETPELKPIHTSVVSAIKDAEARRSTALTETDNPVAPEGG